MVDPQRFRLGFALMDEQHEHLLELINRLGDPANDLGPLINDFNAYAEAHFQLEESLMREHGYPNAAAHLAQHVVFRARFAGLVEQAMVESLVARRAMYAWLERWWVGHIGTIDRKLSEFLREKLRLRDKEAALRS